MSGGVILGAILAALPDDAVEELADTVLDAVENLVEKTPTKIDDAVVLSLMNKARKVFGIEDGDD